MTPSSNRAQAAIIGLNSAHLYKQAVEGDGGIMDTLANFWHNRSDAEKGALIGGVGGAAVGGLTAPKGSGIKRALALGLLGAGGGAYLGNHFRTPEQAAFKPMGQGLVELGGAMPGDKPQNVAQRIGAAIRDNPAPGVEQIAEGGQTMIDAGKGVYNGAKSWLTGEGEPALPGSPEATALELRRKLEGKRKSMAALLNANNWTSEQLANDPNSPQDDSVADLERQDPRFMAQF